MSEKSVMEQLEEMEREAEAIEKRMNEREAQGLADIYKYFDRINDKLSSFNNMLVAGYFALATFSPGVSKWILIIPLINMLILIRLDYRMMEQGRIMSQIKSQPQSVIDKYGRKQGHVTLLSLFTIITTLIVTIVLLVIVNQVIIPKIS
ncbi:MAG: hypothetical protein JST82_01455 [Bacteroidetes bacterium]|nr:hypothetical protein [Bacteroidota bacterium]